MKNEQDIEYEKSICYNEGRAEGMAEKALSAAKNLLAEGIDAQTIAKCTGLTLEEVLSLNKETTDFTCH